MSNLKSYILFTLMMATLRMVPMLERFSSANRSWMNELTSSIRSETQDFRIFSRPGTNNLFKRSVLSVESRFNTWLTILIKVLTSLNSKLGFLIIARPTLSRATFLVLKVGWSTRMRFRKASNFLSINSCWNSEERHSVKNKTGSDDSDLSIVWLDRLQKSDWSLSHLRFLFIQKLLILIINF